MPKTVVKIVIFCAAAFLFSGCISFSMDIGNSKEKQPTYPPQYYMPPPAYYY